MYNKLVYLLDRLANSSYTPSYLYKDMSVNKSTSSIMMEESTPAIMSNEQSKAPEEVWPFVLWRAPRCTLVRRVERASSLVIVRLLRSRDRATEEYVPFVVH